jgi:hypothetical protein
MILSFFGNFLVLKLKTKLLSPAFSKKKKGDIEIGSVCLSAHHTFVSGPYLCHLSKESEISGTNVCYSKTMNCVMHNNQTLTSRVEVALAHLRSTLSI